MTMPLAPLFAENSLFKAVGDIFHPLFIAVADVLSWIYGIVPTYAAAIVLLTLLIMALLTPLTIKSTRSMLAMQALQPEMQKLRAKYKGAENRQQLNEELMKLYREHGVSPTGGCLPMFLQMPALIVLYDVIRGLANTVKKGALLTTGKACSRVICATPHYVPQTSAIHKALVKTPGVMHSIGLNLALRPLTHHTNWYEYVPYFGLLAIAVALQYFQMAQMTRRNKRNNTQQQMPQQMQTMQRVMPLIFAYIYFLVPAGVVIYMIVSSAIRVLTQDLIFRYGLVQGPSERQVSGKPRLTPPTTAPTTAPSAAVEARSTGVPKQGSPPVDGERRALPLVGRRGAAAGEPPAQGGAGAANGQRRSARKGTTNGSTPPAPKPHPRSKAKRARKAR
jgi:YidC/Oxa1 family membrane protein insertase